MVSPPAGTGAAGLLTYWSATSTVSSSLSLFWDNPNIRLGIGTSQPSSTLHIVAGTTGATTLQLMGLPNQTGNLMTVSSSSGQRYFTLSSLGVASSSEFRTPSSTIGTLFDTQGNKYATSSAFTAGVDTQLLFGQIGGGATSSVALTLTTSTSNLVFSGSNLSIASAATSTSLVFIQGTQTGSTTLLAMGMAGQTANLFSVASSNGVRVFEVTNAGVASSSFFIAVNASTSRLDVSGSSTLKDFTFASASSTGNLTIGGTFQSNAGQTTLGSVSSTNLFASGYAFLTNHLGSVLGIGTNSTSTSIAIFQAQGLASTTLLIQATSSQTGDLFRVTSSSGQSFFQILAPSGLASSTSFIAVNASTTQFDVSGSSTFPSIAIATSSLPSNALFQIATTTDILTALRSGIVGIGTANPNTATRLVLSDSAAVNQNIMDMLGSGGSAGKAGFRNLLAGSDADRMGLFLGDGASVKRIWLDNSDNLLIGGDPTSNTDGTVIGTQTSVRDTKQDITDYTDYSKALQLVLDAPLHKFRYKNEAEAYGDDPVLAKLRLGYIADEVDPLFM